MIPRRHITGEGVLRATLHPFFMYFLESFKIDLFTYILISE